MIQVMIIEDDPMVRDINSKFLKRLTEFSLVKSAASLMEARDFISENEVDLILLDIYLPNENGIDFLKWIRKQEIEVDVILITADKTNTTIQEVFRFGAADYLIKPFTFERFRESLISYKERYYDFRNQEILEQDVVDKYIYKNHMMDETKEEDESEFEKGINKYTYNAILQEIIKYEESYATAEAISEKVGVANVTVRRYLQYMEKEGKVNKVIEYGRVGRPQHKYNLRK